MGSSSSESSLLADARRFREMQQSTAGKGGGGVGGTTTTEGSENEEGSIKTLTINILSTIVTADFFVVVGLLLWFLVGVFCSKVLGDDGVYLRFAGLFETVVQP